MTYTTFYIYNNYEMIEADVSPKNQLISDYYEWKRNILIPKQFAKLLNYAKSINEDVANDIVESYNFGLITQLEMMDHLVGIIEQD